MPRTNSTILSHISLHKLCTFVWHKAGIVVTTLQNPRVNKIPGGHYLIYGVPCVCQGTAVSSTDMAEGCRGQHSLNPEDSASHPLPDTKAGCDVVVAAIGLGLDPTLWFLKYLFAYLHDLYDAIVCGQPYAIRYHVTSMTDPC